MIPEYQRLDAPKPSFLIPFGRFCLRVVSLPLYSFVFCVAWSVIFDFERSTDTHCHVWNLLPSISAAIGNYQPQRFVWQLAITLHAAPRFIVAAFYHKRYQNLIRSRWRWLAALATLLNVIENVALLGLTYFTSVDHYGKLGGVGFGLNVNVVLLFLDFLESHKFFFITFIATSETYMLLSYLLNKFYRRQDLMSTAELRAVQFKGILFLINLVSFACAGLCFVRHNSHCEPGGEWVGECIIRVV